MIASFRAENLKARKRWANWILIGILLAWILLLTYLTLFLVVTLSPKSIQGPVPASLLKRRLFPENFVPTVLGAAGTIGAAIMLIFGALSTASEFGWLTVQTILIQKPTRAAVLLGKFLAGVGGDAEGLWGASSPVDHLGGLRRISRDRLPQHRRGVRWRPDLPLRRRGAPGQFAAQHRRREGNPEVPPRHQWRRHQRRLPCDDPRFRRTDAARQRGTGGHHAAGLPGRVHGLEPADLPAAGRRRQLGRFRWLVQEQPVHAEGPGRLLELIEVDRLDDVAVDAQPVALDQVTLLARRGQHHDRDGAGPLVLLDPLQNLEAVDEGQLDVEQDHVRLVFDVARGVATRAEDVLERLLPVAHDLDPVRQVIPAQLVEGQRLVVGVVLEHQDVYAAIDVRHGWAPFNVK